MSRPFARRPIGEGRALRCGTPSTQRPERPPSPAPPVAHVAPQSAGLAPDTSLPPIGAQRRLIAPVGDVPTRSDQPAATERVKDTPPMPAEPAYCTRCGRPLVRNDFTIKGDFDPFTGERAPDRTVVRLVCRGHDSWHRTDAGTWVRVA